MDSDQKTHQPHAFSGHEASKIWERLSYQGGRTELAVLAVGDTSTKPFAPEGDGLVVSYSRATGDAQESITLLPCTDECQHGDEELNDSFRVVIRPDGLLEKIHPKKDDLPQEVEVVAVDAQEFRPEQRKGWPPPSQICAECSNYDFAVLSIGVVTSNEDLDEYDAIQFALAALEKSNRSGQPFHTNYPGLKESAKSCASCTALLSTLPDLRSFTSDDSRPIILSNKSKVGDRMERSTWCLEVGFPAVDSRHPSRQVTRYGRIDVVVAHDEPPPPFWPLEIVGRPVLPANTTEQARQWIDDCLKNHTSCRSNLSEQRLPTRVIHIPSDESMSPWLEDGYGREDDYVALSYRWGTAKLSKTLLGNISEHKKALPVETLSKTIQQSITMTRKLGFKYLWADCLCIIQDSPEDWKQEASRMAEVYRNAALTLSASVCESADSGFFYEPPDDYQVRLQARSVEGTVFASFYIVVRSCSSFESDVEDGTLSKRGWCLQERLLSRRILHFGTSQTHWECLEGFSSADSGSKLESAGVELRRKFQFELQTSVPRKGPMSLMAPEAIWVKPGSLSAKEHPQMGSSTSTTPWPPVKQVYGYEPHGTWYFMLGDYSNRTLTVPTDKLAALSGLASTFAEKTGDRYLSGLWLNGLPEGLLWSSVGLGIGLYGQKSWSTFPPTHRAPTWSWAALDGPVRYSNAKYSAVDAVVHAYSMPGRKCTGTCCNMTHGDTLGLNPFQRLTLKVRLKALEDIDGFKKDQRRFLQDNRDSRGTFLVPHACWDDPEYDEDNLEGVIALFIAQVGCGNKDCDHLANCGGFFGHCLLVKGNEEGRKFTFRRLGVAQCHSGEFSGIRKAFITLV